MERETHSHWIEEPLPAFPPITTDVTVDVAIVGGGVTGITTAYLLKRQGVKVALVERDRLACGESARTTAHLTYVTDERLHTIARTFGRDAAKQFWKAGQTAIDQIEQLVKETQAPCEFRRIPGYLHAAGEDPVRDADELHADLELARDFGFAAQYELQPPYANGPGILFAEQAKFHPRKYLASLIRQIPGEGSHVFEHTTLDEAHTAFVVANGHRIHCDYLVIATHNPLMGRRSAISSALFQTKLALYTTHVLGARLPAGVLPEALFWDTRDPYDYLRVDAGHTAAGESEDYVIFGGEDVKTGQEQDAVQPFRALKARLLDRLPMAKVQDRWLGQVIETDDGLPFIGETAERQFIATGFAGNGFTLGTVAAIMARDRYLGRESPWKDLFAVDRKPFHGGMWRYLSENVDYPYYFLRDRILSVPTGLEGVRRNEGTVIDYQGKKVAAFRDENGEVTVCSAVCTHMKCLVHWNAADKTWDCPCHGSRFRPTGEVLSGPAESALAPHESSRNQRTSAT